MTEAGAPTRRIRAATAAGPVFAPEDPEANISSSASFAVGFSAMAGKLSDADLATVLKAITDDTPRLRSFLVADLRDREIRELAKLYEGTPTGVAKAMARDLQQYHADSWPRERECGPAAGASEKRRRMFRIVEAGQGSGISLRSIFDAIEVR
jgi:hypothetical protein